MTNQVDPAADQSRNFQAAPTIMQSDELDFTEDAGSFIAQLAMGNLMLKNIEDSPTIQLNAEQSKKGGYNIRSVVTMENDRDCELYDVFSSYAFHNIPAHAVDQIMRYANMSSLALQIYKTQSLELVKQAKAMKEARLPSVVYADMTQEEVAKLPLPCIITAEKHVVLSLLDEDGDIVSREAWEAEQDEQREGYDEATKAAEELYLTPKQIKEKKQKERDLEKRDEELEEDIERIEAKYGIDIEINDPEDMEPPYEYHAEMISRGLPEEVGGALFASMEMLRAPSEFLAILEYDKENVPTYVVLGVDPAGVREMTRIKPEQGQLVSIVTKALTNLRDDILGSKIGEDQRHLQMRGLSDFDCNIIEEHAETLDRVHCLKYGW